ncbi:MAG: hypothetical protein NC489_17720 [Ruminococcus flavefaciens]|nr:hypothetical protein [Ruminococcus flavefaciens]
MRIQISKDVNHNTSVKIDGVELNTYISDFRLSQKAGNPAALFLEIPVAPLDSLEVDLPEGVVIVDNTRDQD